MGPLLQTARRLTDSFVNVLMPPRCVACGTRIAQAGLYCHDCFAELPLIPEPLCTCCGHPLPVEEAANLVCFSCQRQPPAYRHARAAYFYDGVARKTVIAFKYGQESLAPLMANAMLRAADGLLDAETVVVPVPLHRWRLAKRGFNQALLLARPLAAKAGARLEPAALLRTKPAPASIAMSAKARARRVSGAFAVGERAKGTVAGKHILLVDDVMTTGATVSACARALRKAGARSVDALVFARVAAPRPNT